MIPQTRPRFRMMTLGLAIAVVLSAIPILSQTSRPSFEVAVIKPYAEPTSGPRFFGFQQQPGGRLNMRGVTLKMMMTYAYGVRDFQVLGGPDWINSERYDINAKAEDGTIPFPQGPPDPTTPGPYSLRTQSLIDERFQLKMHRETRDLPIYELVAMKGGAKLQMSEDQSAPKPPEPGTPPPPPPQRGAPPGRGGIFTQGGPAGTTLQATGVQLTVIISALSQSLGRPVVDKTDLKPGLYDLILKWTNSGPGGAGVGGPPGGDPGAAPTEPEGASIFTAIQEQLGLRLVSTKGPVEVIVIDSVQKPVLE